MKPGRTYYYFLPEVNFPDQIEFALGHSPTDSQLKECDSPCYNLDADGRIAATLEDDWPLSVKEDEILVYLSMKDSNQVYKIPLIIEFDARVIEKEQGPNVVESEKVWIDPNAWVDEPDYEEDDTETALVKDELKCLPLYTRSNR